MDVTQSAEGPDRTKRPIGIEFTPSIYVRTERLIPPPPPPPLDLDWKTYYCLSLDISQPTTNL